MAVLLNGMSATCELNSRFSFKCAPCRVHVQQKGENNKNNIILFWFGKCNCFLSTASTVAGGGGGTSIPKASVGERVKQPSFRRLFSAAEGRA